MYGCGSGALAFFFIATLFAPHDALMLPRVGSGAGSLDHGRVVVCYVGTWATYRPDQGKFTIENIDPSLCTHLIYAFAGLDAASNTIKSLDPFNDLEENYGKGSYNKMTSMKSKYPGLKVSLAIGGWNEGSANYSTMAANPVARKTFTKSVLEFIQKYDFDGLDLDWEFPGKRGGKPEDKANFVELIKDLRKDLVPGKYLLTAALGAGIDTIVGGYDLPSLNALLDYIHLMCYDYHGSWETVTGANAPLYSSSSVDQLTVEKSVRYVLENGVDPKKLVVGVPLYGRTFVLAGDETTGSLGEPSLENKGFQGPYTKTDGFLGYNEICMEMKEGNWTEHWDNVTLTPFASNGNKIITYDDAKSLKEKIKFAIGEENVAGIMVWSMDTDDFSGTCAVQGGTYNRYPLLNSLNEALVEAVINRNTPRPVNPNHAPQSAVTSLIVLFFIPFIHIFV